MKLYPLMLNVQGSSVVIAGGGAVAARKAGELLRAGAHVRVIAPRICSELSALAESSKGKLELEVRSYSSGDLNGAVLVFAAADSADVNAEVTREAKNSGIPVNSADDPENSTFHVPSSFSKGELVLALSTGGASPALAARLRREIESLIPENIETVLSRMKRARELLKDEKIFPDKSSSERGDILRKIANDDSLLKEITQCSSDHSIISLLKKYG